MQTVHRRNHFLGRPATQVGQLALWLLVAHFVFLLSFFVFATGESGGASFFDNLWLVIPVLLTGLFGVAAGVTAGYAILTKHERSIFTWLSMVIGLFVILFAAGEFFG